MDFYKNLSAGFVGQAATQKELPKESEKETPSAQIPDLGEHDMGKMMGMFQEAMSSDPSMKKQADSLWKFLGKFRKQIQLFISFFNRRRYHHIQVVWFWSNRIYIHLNMTLPCVL